MSTSSTGRMPELISQALDKDPAFRVLTMDGVGWIDPYTGNVVPAPFGHGEIAKKYLLEQRPWTTLKAKPLKELLYLRWLHYLRAHLEFIEHLRIFKQGMWLNPYTGEWVPGITLINHQITRETIEDLARLLGECHEAQSGKMLEKFRIDILVAAGPDARSLKKAGVENRPTSAKPARSRTDFHHVKNQFMKMLSRPPRIEGYQMVMHYEPHSVIPRNFYDFISLDRNRLLIIIGDFAGQGPGAALMVASTMRSLRRLAAQRADLIDLIASLNDEIRIDLFPGCAITLFAAVLNIPFNSLTCLSVGFHPAVLVNPRREITLQQIHSNGEVLGRTHGQPFRDTLRPVSIELQSGDIVVLYTDGLAKGRNRNDLSAGRLAVMGSCLSNIELPCARMLERVLEEAKRGFGKNLTDDLTALALRVKEEGEPVTGRFSPAPSASSLSTAQSRRR